MTLSLKNTGAINIIVLVGVFASFIIPKIDEMRDWRTSQKLIAQQDQAAEIQRRNIERQREIADAAEENQIADIEELIVQNYVANPEQDPQIDWVTSVDPTRKTMIYDKYKACVGYALNGVFVSVFRENEACNRTQEIK